MAYSTGLESFLNFLRETESQYRQAAAAEQEANDTTQDLLHRLELQQHTYHEYAAISRELATVRQERRAAKDTQVAAGPICQWVEENRPVVKALERLLGEVRKAEKRTEGRIYTPRSKKQEEGQV